MRKATKTIKSFAVVLIAGLNFVVPAFAQDPFTAIAVGGLNGASGAGLFGSMAAMSGINIDYVSDPVNDSMWNKLNPESIYFSGEKHEATGQGEDIYDYINVDIGDWLDAQSDFIINFAQTNNVTDNDSGTVNAVVICGIPVSAIGSGNFYYQSSPFYVTSVGAFSFGPFTVTCDRIDANNRAYGSFSSPYFNTRSCNWLINTEAFYLASTSTFSTVRFGNSTVNNPITGMWTSMDVNNPTYDSDNLNWSSGTVNTSVFDGWESAKVKIPKSISQLQTGWTLSDFLNELDRIWYGAGENNIIIEDGRVDPPVPPVPVPSTPLGDVPFDDWVDLWGQGIYEQLENQSDALDFIGSNGEDAVEELESIDSNIGDIKEDTGSIDTNIGIGNGLLGGIKSAAESAVEFLEGIAEHVEELVEEIVEGTETLIAGILNQIPSVFGVIFGPIKQASSIWHYVVEWIQSISAPMTWMWSIAGSTSYYIQLPIYASLAGAVVLAFYKRFGK